MLVLSRQRDESIIIGDNIVLTVVDIRGDKVRLGIDAPKEIPVHRQEVYEAIQRENRRAAEQNTDDGETAATSAPADPERDSKLEWPKFRCRDMTESEFLPPMLPIRFKSRACGSGNTIKSIPSCQIPIRSQRSLRESWRD